MERIFVTINTTFVYVSSRFGEYIMKDYNYGYYTLSYLEDGGGKIVGMGVCNHYKLWAQYKNNVI